MTGIRSSRHYRRILGRFALAEYDRQVMEGTRTPWLPPPSQQAADELARGEFKATDLSVRVFGR
jgi:hypothetical protein